MSMSTITDTSTGPSTDTRTLVYIDNQGGFEPHAKIANGNHIEVEGDTVTNPFHIEKVPDEALGRLDADPYSMAADSARTLIAGTMRNQGTDLSEIIHTLDDLIHETYRDAEIYPDDFESHANTPPDMTDMIRVGEDILDNPSEYTTSSSELEADELEDEMAKLMRRLNGFTPTGKHRNLVGQSEVTIKPGMVNYIDLRNVDTQDPAKKSVQLFQMLRNVYEAFKIAPGESKAIFDEAHNFLEDLQMVQWLATASRQLRNYDGALWLVSQSPWDFASKKSDSSDLAQLKDKIREQCSIIDMFQQNTMDKEIAEEKFNMGANERSFVTDEAVAGEADMGFTTAITKFSDRSGWYEYEIKRGPVVLAANSYKRSKHGPFEPYMDTVLEGAAAYNPAEHDDPHEFMEEYLVAHGYAPGSRGRGRGHGGDN